MVHDEHTKILIEIGISWKKIQRVLDFKTHDLVGVIVTHGHSDHIGHAKEAMKAGVDVFCSQQAADMAKLEGHRLNIIQAGRQFKIGTWTIFFFDAIHDVETLGFLIGTPEKERLLYLTDSAYAEHRFSGLTHIMIEANYIEEILSHNIQSEYLPSIVGRRVRRSHFSLKNAIAFLMANDLSKCREIWLLHLSDSNSDEKRMKKEIQEATGVPVYVA